MEKSKQYPIEEFYVGELYLYTSFGNLLAGNSIFEGKDKIQSFSLSGAINFQKDLLSRYTDWENRREYQGFLTIFYKQGNKYICLHDGVSYELDGSFIIDNLVPLSELLPKIDAQVLSKINVYKALQLFDILFQNNKDESQLYIGSEQPISDFFIGDIALKERTTQLDNIDSRCKYFDLPHHMMLGKNSLEIYTFGNEDCISTVYRCLFLRDGVDLYNINNNQFYNHNEDAFDSIVNFKEYMTEYKIDIPSECISIPKALSRFKKTL